MSAIPLIIPSYQPGERLIELIGALRGYAFGPIVLVDDGSGPHYAALFDRALELLGDRAVLLRHEDNRGKGAALKTAFRWALDLEPELLGVVTADSDGQHSPRDVERIALALVDDPHALILGSRRFDGPGVPWASRFGNTLTSRVLAAVAGLRLTDTQTGLRAIPADLLPALLEVEGERFEYETRVLLELEHARVKEIEIETIYDSPHDHATHFDPLRDSIRIYRIFLGEFLRFSSSSLMSALVDLAVFQILATAFRAGGIGGAIALATIIARIASSTVNYLANRRIVFRSTKAHTAASPRYFALVIAIMAASAAGTTILHTAFPFIAPVIVKIGVDALLFLVSYRIQRRHVF